MTRLTILFPLLASGAMAVAADTVPAPPPPGVTASGAAAPDSAGQPTNGPALSPPAIESSPSREVENTAAPMPQPPAIAPMNQPPAQPAVLPPIVSQPEAPPAVECTPVMPAPPEMPFYAPCATSVCGPFGPPQFGNAPGPGTGVAVPPVPPAYLAAPTGVYGSWCGDHSNPVVGFNSAGGGIHDRYPYYSYRRPWYTAGPASANVTIVW
jgi:hypothetical protein